MVNLGKALKTALFTREIRQKELADRLQTTPQQVSSWANNGSISHANIEAICNELNMKFSEFIALGEGD